MLESPSAFQRGDGGGCRQRREGEGRSFSPYFLAFALARPFAYLSWLFITAHASFPSAVNFHIQPARS